MRWKRWTVGGGRVEGQGGPVQGEKEYMGSRVAGLGAGHETLDGLARPEGVEHGGQRGDWR